MRSILLILTFLLSGCSAAPPEERLHDYAYRVGNAIEYKYQLKFDRTAPAFPPKRQRSLQVDEIREGLIDVLDLRRCGLLELIGERNSSLGKLAPPSQRLIYETRFLPRLRQCIIELEQSGQADADTQTLLSRLHQIEQIKRRNYARVISNAIFNSDEISRHFALQAQPLDNTAPELVNRLIPALTHFEHLAQLAQQSQWPAPEWIMQLEQDYEALYRSDFGADWLRSLLLLTQTLEQTAEAIEARLARRPICFNRKPTPQANIIRNVFQRYYAGQLQPWMSAIDRSGQTWRRQWISLIELLPTSDKIEAYITQVFGEQRGSLWLDYIEARSRHTHAWQQLLSQCGMMPGDNDEG
ncbi:hypothetical protein GCM10009104_06420 [Marinobacterium maritimum]|uniref:DUF3080 domain-containing protein n=1 Tax=Marinobacterium maritimum TaxID=500162 RepID=A0ABN1I2T5_9GAMM